MNYNTLRNKPTINYRELIGDNTVSEVGGITEEEFDQLLDTDLASYYTKAQIDELFARSFVYREKSGSIVTFDCPESTNGIAQVVSDIVAVQSGSGDPSPTNIRPIIGKSAVNVVVSPTTDAADGTTYTTTLKDSNNDPMICYGGKLVNVNGVQTLDNEWLYLTIDRVDVLNTAETSSRKYFSKTIGALGDVVNGEIICDSYITTIINTSTTTVGINIINSNTYNDARINIRPYNVGSYTLASFNAVLAENPIHVKYKLTTPEEIPQDNLAIASQDSTNNIWCDTGDITVRALDRIIQG